MSDHTIFTPHQIAVAPGEGLVIAAAEEDGENLYLHVTTLRAARELLDCAAQLHSTMLDAAAERIAVRP